MLDCSFILGGGINVLGESRKSRLGVAPPAPLKGKARSLCQKFYPVLSTGKNILTCKGPFTLSIFKDPIFVGSKDRIVWTHWKWPSDTQIRNFEKRMVTLFLKDERRWQILHNIPVIVLAPNWRFFVSSQNRILWTHYKCPSDIFTTKTEPWNERLLPVFIIKNRILKIGSCERALKKVRIYPIFTSLHCCSSSKEIKHLLVILLLPGDFRSWESPQTLPALFIGSFEHVERFQNLKFAVIRITDIQNTVLNSSEGITAIHLAFK